MMTKEEARNILSGYVKACREDDMLTLETFGYEDVMEAMSMGAKALQQPSLPSDLEEAAEKYKCVAMQRAESETYDHPMAAFHDGYMAGVSMEIASAFKAGAEWQKKQDEENYAWVKQLTNPNIEKLDGIEITTSDSSAGGKELLYVSNKSYNIGLRDGMAEQKRKMMEGAVEGEVQEVYRDEDGIHCCVSVGTDYKPGTIVYVITIPKEKGQ